MSNGLYRHLREIAAKYYIRLCSCFADLSPQHRSFEVASLNAHRPVLPAHGRADIALFRFISRMYT